MQGCKVSRHVRKKKIKNKQRETIKSNRRRKRERGGVGMGENTEVWSKGKCTQNL
jgi:hypothetical protein